MPVTSITTNISSDDHAHLDTYINGDISRCDAINPTPETRKLDPYAKEFILKQRSVYVPEINNKTGYPSFAQCMLNPSAKEFVPIPLPFKEKSGNQIPFSLNTNTKSFIPTIVGNYTLNLVSEYSYIDHPLIVIQNPSMISSSLNNNLNPRAKVFSCVSTRPNINLNPYARVFSLVTSPSNHDLNSHAKTFIPLHKLAEKNCVIIAILVTLLFLLLFLKIL